MKLQWHVASGLPFLFLSAPLGLLGAIAPDAPWLVAEYAYAKWARRRREWGAGTSWHEWVREGGVGRLPPWVLVAYRLTHSLLTLLLTLSLLCLYVNVVGGVSRGAAFAIVTFYAGWAVHLALDAFTHDRPLLMRPLYPFSDWSIPRHMIAEGWAVDRELGHTYLVPLSGGWESAACVAHATGRAARTGAHVLCVFVDYGQEGAEREGAAATAIAHHFQVPLAKVRTRSIATSSIPARDGRPIYIERTRELCALATRYLRRASDRSTHVIFIGYRAPHEMFDEYGDGNPQYSRMLRTRYGYNVKSPVIMWPKWWVKRTVRRAGVPDAFIHSSER